MDKSFELKKLNLELKACSYKFDLSLKAAFDLSLNSVIYGQSAWYNLKYKKAKSVKLKLESWKF